MGKSKEEAMRILDDFLYDDIENRVVYNMDWDVAYKDNRFVVWDKQKNKFHHFRVVIESHEWKSEKVRGDCEWGKN